jgi:hypothetical protein
MDGGSCVHRCVLENDTSLTGSPTFPLVFDRPSATASMHLYTRTPPCAHCLRPPEPQALNA